VHTLWLAERLRSHEFIVGRHHLIVGRYDYEKLRDLVRSLCAECRGETWQEVAERLGRIGKWESEDYIASP
jgi:hypothetical protein